MDSRAARNFARCIEEYSVWCVDIDESVMIQSKCRFDVEIRNLAGGGLRVCSLLEFRRFGSLIRVQIKRVLERSRMLCPLASLRMAGNEKYENQK